MNKFERAKQEKDGLDVFPALMRAAEVGWESLDDDDVMRLKWYGLYAHNAKDGHFMLRTKVVQGVLERRPGRGHGLDHRRLRRAGSSTARRASASRTTG